MGHNLPDGVKESDLPGASDGPELSEECPICKDMGDIIEPGYGFKFNCSHCGAATMEYLLLESGYG